MALSSSSSSSCDCSYDVFPSFSGEDVRKTFLSHFLKELDRKLIIAFKDNKIERSRSISPELVNAIRGSRIAVVVFSKNYASSSWCLDELLEIVRCQEKYGQLVVPIFYGLDPSDIRKQLGEFGEAFQKTCKNRTEEVKNRWQKALTDVANILGYHSRNCNSEATMIEEIANDLLVKLNLTPSKDFENFVGIEYHISNMSLLLHLESEEVRMVSIWGSSGVGKTTIARTLFTRLSRHFQGCVFIDRRFISTSMEVYSQGNPDDYNMKLHLQEQFLSKILNIEGIEVDHLGAVREKLKHKKVLIFIDDLDDQVVLDALVGQTQWFGGGSRIIVVTKDKHFLRAHGIDHIYEVGLPSNNVALAMLCRTAFRMNYPPKGFVELAHEVVFRAGNHPLGLNVLGSYLRGRDKEDWLDMLPRLRNGLDGRIEKTLRVSYDGLRNEKDEAIFRHIACLFNGWNVNDIKQLLANSNLDVDIGLKNLVDKSLIHVRCDTVEMHCLLQEMGKVIVREQSKKPEKREFLIDSKDVCDVLEDNNGTKKILGIALDINETDDLQIHESAFKEMSNLLFLKIYTKKWDQKKEVRWNLPEGFDYLPHKIRLLRWDNYPMRCMPSKFLPQNLIKLQMYDSKLEKLWEGVPSLTGLRNMDLRRSKYLKSIPDLSMATNLETLDLRKCTSLVELTSSIQNLNKLKKLNLMFCQNLETLPTGINLQSLSHLQLNGCSRLRSFPNISTNISELHVCRTAIEEFPSDLRLEKLETLTMCTMDGEKLWRAMQVQPLAPLMTMLSLSLRRLSLSDIPSLVELPSSFLSHYNKLTDLRITKCINLETLPTGINLESLVSLNLSGCSRLKTFPDISRNITLLALQETAIQEVPWWVEKFSKLQKLYMKSCGSLENISANISKLNDLEEVVFSHCGALTGADFCGDSSEEATKADKEEASSSLSVYYLPKVRMDLVNCFNLDQEALIKQEYLFHELVLSGEEVPPYFTHRTTGNSSLSIRLPRASLSRRFVLFRACAVVVLYSRPSDDPTEVYIKLNCRFQGRLGNHFCYEKRFSTSEKGSHLLVFDYGFPLNREISPRALLLYNHVVIQFHISNIGDSAYELKGWGLRFFEKDDSIDEDIYDSDFDSEDSYDDDDDDDDLSNVTTDDIVEPKRSNDVKTIQEPTDDSLQSQN